VIASLSPSRAADLTGYSTSAYYLYRHPVTSDQSIFKLLTTRVLPLLVTRPDRPYPTLTILNTGSVRFDIFKGPFTRNDQVCFSSLVARPIYWLTTTLS
jgi:hypothetical protein